MRINAYIMAADPAWIEASVMSYYEMVSRIVVSYDQESLGWTGGPLDVEQCLRRLRAIDRQGKLDYRPGHYARPAFFKQPLENDTYQRNRALEAAQEGADWIVQLDTDEVLGSAQTFAEALEEANRAGRAALNYPSLWLYCKAFGDWYLESGERGWRRSASYPGPMALRTGAVATLARRTESRPFHVDLRWSGSSGRVPNDITVDRVIRAEAAIWHFSAVRDEAWLRRKYRNSGHALDRDWHPEIRRWMRTAKHPLLRVCLSQLERGHEKRPLKLGRIPPAVRTLLAASCISDRPIAEADLSTARPLDLPNEGNRPEQANLN